MVDEVGESGDLAVLHGRGVVYVVEGRARHRPRPVTGGGGRIPSHLPAGGRAVLAALPAPPLRVLYGHAADFTARTDVPGPSRPKELRELLAGVRREGVARESGEVTEELASVAAVVRDHAGWPAAAVALTFVEQAADGPRRAL